MVRIFPESPVGLRNSAEREFYNASKRLPGDWVVFANVITVVPQYEGEADFVLAHPDTKIIRCGGQGRPGRLRSGCRHLVQN